MWFSAEGRSAVVGQQREEQGAEHTALGGPHAQNGGSGCVTADPHCLRPLAVEVQQPIAQGSAEPKLVHFADQLLRDDGVEC